MLAVCNVPENPVNGMVSIATVIPVGLVATYTCNGGLVITGEQNRTCLSVRMWSGQPPTCEEGMYVRVSLEPYNSLRSLPSFQEGVEGVCLQWSTISTTDDKRNEALLHNQQTILVYY